MSNVKVGAVLVLCTVRDSAMQAFSPPFAAGSVGSAMRGFSDECNRDGSEYWKHPEDYELYELGSFDEFDASVSLLSKPRLVARGVDQKVPDVVKQH